jgi:hypothetical protein
MKKNNKVDPKYIDIPNICFSLTKPDDEREEKFQKQRLERGFDDSETWSLRDTIANFILPRLKVFLNLSYGENGVLVDENDEMKIAINKMIRSFELVSRDNGSFILTKEEKIEYEEGMKMFKDYFLGLWW